jgi:hypothetical protein
MHLPQLMPLPSISARKLLFFMKEKFFFFFIVDMEEENIVKYSYSLVLPPCTIFLLGRNGSLALLQGY